MKLLVIFLALRLAAAAAFPAAQGDSLSAVAGDAQAVASADWNWRRIGHRAEVGYSRLEIFSSVQSVSIIRYKSSRYRTEVINDPGEAAAPTSLMSFRHDALGAVNGSYFNMKTLIPTTYVKEDRVEEGNHSHKESFRIDGVLAIRGRRVDIFPCKSDEYQTATGRYRDVIAAGPMLLIDGRVASLSWPEKGFFRKRHPRTFVGTTTGGWVYFVVVDGRFPGQGEGMTIAETAAFAAMLGLDDAINLDGGGSSTLWTSAYGVESHPCDNGTFTRDGERRVPNIVIVR